MKKLSLKSTTTNRSESFLIFRSAFILFCSIFLFLLTVSANAQTWQLVWSDEFDSDSLDMSKWEYQIGTGASEGLNSWGNNELQYYTDREENLYIQDGMLHIRALAEQFVNRNYTSARIRTKDKGDWRYGKFEIRAKLPTGRGLWPAIWMLPTDNVYGGWPKSGEIDIMELVGHRPHIVHGTVHYGPDWPNNVYRGSTYMLSEGTFNDDFHTFSIIWEPGIIRWYVDDILYYQVTPNHLSPHNWPFDQKFHFILNVAVGGNWPGSPDGSTEFPQEMIVEYVRVYQDSEATSTEQFIDNPQIFKLNSNYPNPFNPSTNFSFQLPEPSQVQISVFDIMGRKVATPVNGFFPAGTHNVSFDAENLSSGTYIYRMNSGAFQQSRLMMLIK